ncbi:glycosyltransferase [Williamsoniiplasma somnilux]|uniref:Glycosyltransferase n=1 Tax=Williamsoniiplasma somnilux TaxID=215578 RepID=A0A2K8P0P5_9MOLU|nr:glycosyltransferase family 2 protein [Williamsoniiplasma somnilux]ATZ19008.1 glycosyltransferase [Williamsoniiplasma somnilux]
MLISFIILSAGREERIFKTINSLKRQSNLDYELIVINDDPYVEKESLDFLRDQFEQNDNMLLVFNNKSQGASTNWNTALQLAQGEYITFIKEGDILEPNFVETINKNLKSVQTKIDIIQYKQMWSGLHEGVTECFLEDSKIYNLGESKEVFAYINQNIYGKLFRLNYLKDFRITFRSSVRFDSLFLFKALGHARTFLQIPEVISSHRMGILKYSAFDLVNQWPHILNYYRRIGTYKELRDELNYAYTRELTYDFLSLVSKFENKQLYKKALKYVNSKMENKLEQFAKSNKSFLKSSDYKFVKYINEFESFIANELKHNK